MVQILGTGSQPGAAVTVDGIATNAFLVSRVIKAITRFTRQARPDDGDWVGPIRVGDLNTDYVWERYTTGVTGILALNADAAGLVRVRISAKRRLH